MNEENQGVAPSSRSRAATPSGPSPQAVSGIAGIPNAEIVAGRLCDWSLDGEPPVPLMQEAARTIRVLIEERGAFRQQAINRSWNWRMCDAYGQQEYARQLEEEVDRTLEVMLGRKTLVEAFDKRAASGIVAATAGETACGLDERSEQSPAPEGGDAQSSQQNPIEGD